MHGGNGTIFHTADDVLVSGMVRSWIETCNPLILSRQFCYYICNSRETLKQLNKFRESWRGYKVTHEKVASYLAI